MYVKGQFAKTISFSTSPELAGRISSYCSKRGCTRSWFLTQAADLYLRECLEDEEDYKAAAAALREFERGDGKTYTIEELRKEFGL